MKKISALLLCLVLGVTCLTACSNNEEAFTQKSYTIEAEQINELCIDVQDRKIEVALSADDQIHIDYFESSKEYYDISVSDNQTLTMTAVSDNEWTDYIGLKSAVGNRTISMQIPNEQLGTLRISTTNEIVLLPSLAVTGDISISTNGGNLEFDKLIAGKSITLKTKNGDISGSIIGSYDDYIISCNIKKGKSNLPPSKEGGTKTLDVSNNNGDIDIEFVGE